MSGGIIYKITNTINQKSYIGLTTGTLERRMRQHHYDSKHNVDRPLYRAMRKYGEEAFTSKIIDTADTLEALKKKEQYWINFYNTYGANSFGYNATKGGDIGTVPPVAYLKVSLRTGEILEEFSKATDCCSCLADKITQTQYNDYVLIKKEKTLNMTPLEIKEYAYSLRPKVICQLDKNNQLIARWMNSSDILKQHPDYDKGCIMACLWGKRKTHKKYQWKYYKDWRDGLSDMQA